MQNKTQLILRERVGRSPASMSLAGTGWKAGTDGSLSNEEHRMNTTLKRNLTRLWILPIALFLAGMVLLQNLALALDLTVVDGSGAPVSGYRWLLEEDNTNPGVPGIPKSDSVSLVIHKSHAPVVATGSSAFVPTDLAKRYVLSVLADGYQLGGLALVANQTTATVILNKHPIPTAQINVLVYHDNNSINNAPDATEAGLPGFQIVLADFLGGPVLEDAFANPLGTTYKNIDYATGAFEVDQLGDGSIYTDANGKALIKYLPMGKYGVQCIPPTGSTWMGGQPTANIVDAWHQTATIEGTLTVDAWVKANEPRIFMEGFGPGFYHVFFGFVDPGKMPSSIPGSGVAIGQPTAAGNVTLTGFNRFNHFGRPPNNQQFVVGPAVSEAWVGLNEFNAAGVAGRGLYITRCDPSTGAFSISNVPPGRYQLVTWDTPLDALFGFNTITVQAPDGDAVQELGNVLSFRWFGSMEGSVFYDENENGLRDQNEEGIPQQVVNLRWRDGTVYQSTLTDLAGEYALTEIFPFFKWLVAEVDFARFKATGMTTVVDEGGGIDSDFNPLTPPILPLDNGWNMPSGGVRNPQPQFVLNADGTQTATPINNITGNHLSRTEVGPVLTQGVQIFLNQNNLIDWGKKNYAAGENGGISGVVAYQTTRAEEDPRNGTTDPWEPGVPRAQVALYQDADNNQIIDDLSDADGVPTVADVDNYPQGDFPGPGDVDHNHNGTFDPGDAIQITWTDSWDAVVEESPTLGAQQPNPPVILNKPIIGSDNYPTWNQVRPQVFDGGYAFASVPPGNYIVQAFPPPNYKIQTEESVNVVFGDSYIPSKLLLPPELVGTADNHVNDLAYLQSILPAARAGAPFVVPSELTLFPGQHVAAPFASQTRPLADMKHVRVADGKNTAADFHIYTEVPKATRVVGFVLNDLTAEFNAFSPIFGEKGSPGWLPISFRDWAGHEVARTYSDEHGSYEAVVPSTYNVAAPAPSGVAPNMLTMVLNDPTMPNPLAGQAGEPTRIPDPFYNPAFATTPWTLHYYPGTFLYADTPIVPIAAFVGGPNKQLDVEPPNLTPVIKSVTVGPVAAPIVNGPFVPVDNTPANRIVNIEAMGLTSVPNPNYNPGVPDPAIPATVNRNFGFGTHTAGDGAQVTINGVAIPEADIVSWANLRIRVRVDSTFDLLGLSSGQLMVTRASGNTSPIGVTLTRGRRADVVHYVTPVDPTVNPLATPIQDKIDLAGNGDLIVVAPGFYNENPILWKPVRLQGSGRATVIDANPTPAERLSAWHSKVVAVLAGDPFAGNEAPGIMVLGNAGADFASAAASIDGFLIKGAIAGGGIVVYDQADNLRISNNRIIGNQGGESGGISVGVQTQLGILYDNPNILIERNEILQNGGINGAGGIGIYTGAVGYKIRDNFIMANFTRASGGGISHEGVSEGGLIANNVIAYNEVFYGVPAGAVVISGDGGGIYIGGEIAPGGLSGGSGSVTIINNLIQGNLAGAGHGGGIRLSGVNGADSLAAPADPSQWYALDIFNNVIVNNVAGHSGGGISLQDATRVRIIHNTVANNDSTATARGAFNPPDATTSEPQGAGIVSHLHSALLAGVGGQLYADPVLQNNIIWHNRSYYYDSAPAAPAVPGLFAATPAFNDIEIAEMPGMMLNPVNCLFSPVPGPGPYPAGNVEGNPQFIRQLANNLSSALVVDEAGNNLSVRFQPIGIYRPAGTDQYNYHIDGAAVSASAALDAGAALDISIVSLANDFDGEARFEVTPDIGADQLDARISIIPPAAPNITVAQDGPAAIGTPAPTVTPLLGANVLPGPMVKPGPLNPLPGAGLVDPEPGIDSDGDGNFVNDLKYIRLSGGDGFVTMADRNVLYMFGFADLTHLPTEDNVRIEGLLKAEMVAPTIVLKEGQHVYIDLANVGMVMRPDLFDPHTIHFHGFPQAATIFDGEPMASLSVNMGSILRYYYRIVEPGTFFYHCHVEATEHMEMGMIGNLWVEPKQNMLANNTVLGTWTHHTGQKYAYNDGDGSTRYDVEAPIQIVGFDRNFHEQHILVQPLPFSTLHESYPMFNGRGYPDTINPNPITTSIAEDGETIFQNDSQKVSSLITARAGQRILLRISNSSISDFHTLTVYGLPMTVVGKDARLLRGPDPDGAGPLLGKNLFIKTTSVTLGGGETADVILDTTGVSVGSTFFVYDARFKHLNNDEEEFGGAMTEIRIIP